MRVDGRAAKHYYDNVIADQKRPRLQLKSIKSKILTFAILATLIPSLGLGLLSFWRYQVVINDNVNHELRTLASDTSGELTMWLRERVNEVRALSTAYTLIDGLTAVAAPGTAPIGAREMELYLRSVQKKLDPLLELTLSDTSGRVVASSAPKPALRCRDLAEHRNYRGFLIEPPRWDDTRHRTLRGSPVLSSRNELWRASAARPGAIQSRLR
jgi:hypothetical protein